MQISWSSQSCTKLLLLHHSQQGFNMHDLASSLSTAQHGYKNRSPFLQWNEITVTFVRESTPDALSLRDFQPGSPDQRRKAKASLTKPPFACTSLIFTNWNVSISIFLCTHIQFDVWLLELIKRVCSLSCLAKMPLPHHKRCKFHVFD